MTQPFYNLWAELLMGESIRCDFVILLNFSNERRAPPSHSSYGTGEIKNYIYITEYTSLPNFPMIL